MEPRILAQFPSLRGQFPWIKIIEKPTAFEPMHQLGEAFGHPDLYVKREDQTDSVYGGNKVRNLEFILAHALQLGATHVATVAPRGSNFIAALATHASRLGIVPMAWQFSPTSSPQIEEHFAFSRAHGAVAQVFPGRLGAFTAALRSGAWLAKAGLKGKVPYFIPPGGSSTRGALGHVNALMECSEQSVAEWGAAPDAIIVGAGTRGTMAGLLAGVRLMGLKTHIIGVRCADRIVCNRTAIAHMANALLAAAGNPQRFRAQDIDLRDLAGDFGYGKAISHAESLTSLMAEKEDLALDTTYTTRVVAKMREILATDELRGRRVVYWHTYSPGAKLWAASALRDNAHKTSLCKQPVKRPKVSRAARVAIST